MLATRLLGEKPVCTAAEGAPCVGCNSKRYFERTGKIELRLTVPRSAGDQTKVILEDNTSSQCNVLPIAHNVDDVILRAISRHSGILL